MPLFYMIYGAAFRASDALLFSPMVNPGSFSTVKAVYW
ncbi:uncharacterized protein METZ01_LOCUS478130 [marine metagenome]|uniref:Uncharacterized protein n=1 Tax=marine metagenome TaxID=408172 RepID=A0A383BYH4_9ZZZZ